MYFDVCFVSTIPSAQKKKKKKEMKKLVTSWIKWELVPRMT